LIVKTYVAVAWAETESSIVTVTVTVPGINPGVTVSVKTSVVPISSNRMSA
jgi:hypothetical protein